MKQQLLQDLVEYAECYFDDELIWSKPQYKNQLLLFTEAEYAEQFVRECECKTKFFSVTFEINAGRYVKIS